MKLLSKILTIIFLLTACLTLLMKCDSEVDNDFELPDEQMRMLLYALGAMLLVIIILKVMMVIKAKKK